MLDQIRREVLVQGGAGFLGQNGVDALRPGSGRRAALRDPNLERYEGVGIEKHGWCEAILSYELPVVPGPPPPLYMDRCSLSMPNVLGEKIVFFSAPSIGT